MADITPELVKQLRDKTNASMLECKKALVEAQGNLENAETLLRKKGITKAEGKADRATKEGIIASYIHLAGRVGVLIEVNCETDFVAKNEQFREFVKDITLHIAASSPRCVRREEVSEAEIAKERDIATELLNQEIAKGGKPKPAEIVAKIVEGRVDKYYSTCCLLEQAYIKNPDQTVGDFIKSKIAELGENIQVRRFTRYAVGEEL
jgi:elongation factor Ts